MNIYIQSFGCSSNIHEGEVMAGLLEQAGYTIVNKPLEAEIIILNLCTVKGHHTALQAIKKVIKSSAKMIAAGCIHEHTKKAVRELIHTISFINTHNVHNIVSVVNEVKAGKIVNATAREKKVKIQLPKIRVNPIINIIPIEEGCASACAYCSVKLIKGHVLSYPLSKICKEVQNSIEEGVKEIYVTGQDTGAYGLDKKHGIELPELLNTLCQINGNFMIRVGMTSPNHVHRHLNKLMKAFQHPKIYKFLHIPLQSGSNAILKAMKRSYTVEEYKECIAVFKKAIPEMTFATDIIVGFPGETEDDFQQTINVLQETTPAVVNISRFVPQPHTIAAAMKQVATNTAKIRSKKITDISIKIRKQENKKWLGWKGKILIDESGKNNTMIGRNYAYKQVIVKGDYTIGDEVEVTIKETGIHDLRA